MKVLVNDGIEEIGRIMMEKAGIEVDMNAVPQEQLNEILPSYDGICVRSNTKIRKALIDQCPNLKVIGRGGVGLDNIDVEYARLKGIKVVNTPGASSRSVAELVMSHAYSLSRFLHLAHKEMPVEGNISFGILKKNYAKGREMTGKTIGILGLGRIGKELASLALGSGMEVIAYDPYVSEAKIIVGKPELGFEYTLKTISFDEVLSKSDYISLHIPALDKPVLNEESFEKMKTGVIILNASRGESLDEKALLKNIESGKVFAAGLDVFQNEPQPEVSILTNSKISSTPHIGASTLEAQDKIGVELAAQIIEILLHKNG